MLLKGEYLARQYGADFIIANIDETDLMDEVLRYGPLKLRNENGDLERVVPSVVDLFQLYGWAILQDQPSYLLRLAEKVYLERVIMPRLRRAYYGRALPPTYSQLFAPQLSSDPWSTHAKEIEQLRHAVREMLKRLSAVVGLSYLLITHHPHEPSARSSTE
jgi:hypothetical protein